MSQAEEVAVKNAAQALLKRLRDEKPKVIVQEWHRDRQSQGRVREAVEKVLDVNLPQSYNPRLFKATCDRVYNVIYERAYQGHPRAQDKSSPTILPFSKGSRVPGSRVYIF